MSQFLIMKHIEIDAAHRVPDHGSKCRALHGHRYKIEAYCIGELQDQGAGDGMVMDFSFLKEEMVDHIDRYCDHGLILRWNDPMLDYLCSDALLEANDLKDVGPERWKAWDYSFMHRGLKLYLMPHTPTAENLARHFFLVLQSRIKVRGVRLARIVVWETPTCHAAYPAFHELSTLAPHSS